MFVGIRELSRDTSRIIKDFEQTGEPVVITREGRPIGAIVAVDQSRLEDLVLATAPEFVDRGRRAEEEARVGTTRSLHDAATQRGIQLPSDERSELDLAELATQSAFAQLGGLDRWLVPQLARQIHDDVASSVAAVSAEMIDVAELRTGHQLESAEIREVVALSTELFAQLVRQDISEALSSGTADVAGRLADIPSVISGQVRAFAGEIETVIDSDIGAPALIPTYRAFVAGVQSASHFSAGAPTASSGESIPLSS